ncbi:porin family protein [Amylibacter sp. SFDW26]|uniref:outer membrane protein n=1 Tax=Amylibacter sp. SFDW26 TaxID=2652722 RepID=UPI00126203C2|nr:outer membrane beta-barrel protein [Amylibacter sp. SFDW26]KAB7615780.1 porin family protein [Amylibacter sp. SFDW26]
MLKKSIYTILTATLVTGPAMAGSLATPPEEAPVFEPEPIAAAPTTPNWTGGYIGGQIGYGDVGSNTAGVDGDGAIGGIIAGYDYDFGNWVAGAGVDYDFAKIDVSPTAELENVLRLKLRSGYKIGQGLVYATAGYANADTNSLGDDDGYFAGAGYEHILYDNFSIGGELLYHEFDNFNSSGIDLDATTLQVRGTFRF